MFNRCTYETNLYYIFVKSMAVLISKEVTLYEMMQILSSIYNITYKSPAKLRANHFFCLLHL